MTISASIRRDTLAIKENGDQTQPEFEKAIPYPKSVFFIVVTEFCERFSYYGMRAVLTIYMRNVLNFSDDLATTIYHIFLLLCYGLPIIGGILADSFIGKYKTVVYASSIYAIGNIVLTAASTEPLHLPIVPLSLLGLALMAIGTGGIKPCVVALGGEQFIVPQQEKLLKQFFSVFLFAVSVGNMMSTVITPVLRRDVHCFGEDTCYPLGFGVPGILMITAIFVFIAGKRMYEIKKPEENIILQVIKCTTFALKEKIRNRKSDTLKTHHWLDHARPEFDEHLIHDTKGLFRILIYYVPVPLFFALYEQLGSRWTLQAMKMDGWIGGFQIKPDQMQVANAILMFIFIPFFEMVVYPIFHKCNLLKKPLQKMGVGGVLAALSFVAAGLVEMKIQNTSTTFYSNSQEPYLNFINTMPCSLNIEGVKGHTQIPSLGNLIVLSSDANFAITPSSSCDQIFIKDGKIKGWTGSLPKYEKDLNSIVIGIDNGQIQMTPLGLAEDLRKSKEGNAKLRFVLSDTAHMKSPEFMEATIAILHSNGRIVKTLDVNSASDQSKFALWSKTFEIGPGTYSIMTEFKFRNSKSQSVKLDGEVSVKSGGSYILSIHSSLDDKSVSAAELITITPANEIHMLWLLPQYFLIAWAEVLFIISGMEFSFTEAPESMKSVAQSCWHLANATGNAIVIISAQFNFQQTYAFFGFSALMAIDTVILCLLAIKYKYVDSKPRSLSILSIKRKSAPLGEDESKF